MWWNSLIEIRVSPVTYFRTHELTGPINSNTSTLYTHKLNGGVKEEKPRKSDLETMHVMSIGCPNRATRGQEDEVDCSRGVGVGISLVGLQQGDTF